MFEIYLHSLFMQQKTGLPMFAWTMSMKRLSDMQNKSICIFGLCAKSLFRSRFPFFLIINRHSIFMIQPFNAHINLVDWIFILGFTSWNIENILKIVQRIKLKSRLHYGNWEDLHSALSNEQYSSRHFMPVHKILHRWFHSFSLLLFRVLCQPRFEIYSSVMAELVQVK